MHNISILLLVIIFAAVDFTLCDTRRMYSLSDINYDSPSCFVNNNSMINSLGTVSVSNDEWGIALTFELNLFEHSYSSCSLCERDNEYCKYNVSSNTYLSNDTGINFAIVGISKKDIDLPGTPQYVPVRMDISDKIIMKRMKNSSYRKTYSISIPLKEIWPKIVMVEDDLEEEEEENVGCGSRLKFLILVAVRSYEPMVLDYLAFAGDDTETIPCNSENTILGPLDCLIIKRYRIVNYTVDCSILSNDDEDIENTREKLNGKNNVDCVYPLEYWKPDSMMVFKNDDDYGNIISSILICNRKWEEILIDGRGELELQYVVARLNEINGASIPSMVSYAMDYTIEYLQRSCLEFNSTTLFKLNRSYDVNKYTEILMKYNGGKTTVNICRDYCFKIAEKDGSFLSSSPDVRNNIFDFIWEIDDKGCKVRGTVGNTGIAFLIGIVLFCVLLIIFIVVMIPKVITKRPGFCDLKTAKNDSEDVNIELNPLSTNHDDDDDDNNNKQKDE